MKRLLKALHIPFNFAAILSGSSIIQYFLKFPPYKIGFSQHLLRPISLAYYAQFIFENDPCNSEFDDTETAFK